MIGEVSSLELDETTGKVRVVIQVEKNFLPRLAEEPAISRGILSGDATIDFIPKSKTEPISLTAVYPPESEIPGIAPINARQLLNQAQGVLPNAQESLTQIVNSFRRFEQVAPKVEAALDEMQQLAKSGRELVPELRKTNAKVQDLLGANQPDETNNLKALLQELRDFVKAVKPVADDIRGVIAANKDDFGNTLRAVKTIGDRVNDLLNEDNRKSMSTIVKNFESTSGDVAKLVRLANTLFERSETTIKLLNDRLAQAEKMFANVERATQPYADNSGEMLKNLNGASTQLAATLAEIRDVIRQFGRSDGTLKQLLSDPALYQNLNEAAASLTRTMIRAERVAKDLEVFADKVARRPETIGIGGAIRPSSGLKGSPNAASTGPIFPSVPIGGPMLAPGPYQRNSLAPIPSLPPGGNPLLPPIGVQYRPPRVDLPPPIYPRRWHCR